MSMVPEGNKRQADAAQIEKLSVFVIPTPREINKEVVNAVIRLLKQGEAPTNLGLWRHLSFPENVLAYQFSPDFLQHPFVNTWDSNHDLCFLVAMGAKLGCLVCKAAMISHFQLLVPYDEEKRLSPTLDSWMTDIKEHLFDKGQPPFLCLLTAVFLYMEMEHEWIPLDQLKSWVASMIDQKDYRVFRVARAFPDAFESLDKPIDCPDWLCWRGRHGRDRDMSALRKASAMGSLEAAMFLARTRGLDLGLDEPFSVFSGSAVEMRVDFYERAGMIEPSMPGIGLEMAKFLWATTNFDHHSRAMSLMAEIGCRGDKRAFMHLANWAKLEDEKMKWKKRAEEYCDETWNDAKYIQYVFDLQPSVTDSQGSA